ncbi:MAG: hypothetical protein CBC55_08910 [Gammaproteobacteria bacterium TMED95]|nr:MAG: hypothetical protein CBC55_08910 [Gammaproteobacteria bacterium TMED95]
MNNRMNKNVSKEFRKQLDLLNRWKKKQNPNVTVSSTVKNEEGKEYTKYEKKKANEVWGQPDSFHMK